MVMPSAPVGIFLRRVHDHFLVDYYLVPPYLCSVENYIYSIQTTRVGDFIWHGDDLLFIRIYVLLCPSTFIYGTLWPACTCMVGFRPCRETDRADLPRTFSVLRRVCFYYGNNLKCLLRLLCRLCVPNSAHALVLSILYRNAWRMSTGESFWGEFNLSLVIITGYHH